MKKLTGFSKLGVVAVILVAGFIAFASYLVIDGNNKATDFSKYDFHSYIEADEHTGNIADHVKGSKDAPVLIFEYADYQCRLQGYWKEYSNKLFSEQESWYYATASTRTDIYKNLFEEVTEGKGDVEKFLADLSSPEISKRISFDMGIGKRLEIPGTPTFYVDGQYIDWSNKEGSSVTVNGKKVTWDHNLTGSEFTDLLLEIVDAKLSS